MKKLCFLVFTVILVACSVEEKTDQISSTKLAVIKELKAKVDQGNVDYQLTINSTHDDHGETFDQYIYTNRTNYLFILAC